MTVSAQLALSPADERAREERYWWAFATDIVFEASARAGLSPWRERGLHFGRTRAGAYYAHFKRSDTSEPGFLVGTTGNGNTPEEAIADYARELRGKRLVIDAGSPERREIQCPTEWL